MSDQAKRHPGPWRVDDHPKREYPRVVAERGQFIADCDNAATAAAVAAVPQMLSALETARRYLRAANFDPGNRDAVAFVLECAIANANRVPP